MLRRPGARLAVAAATGVVLSVGTWAAWPARDLPPVDGSTVIAARLAPTTPPRARGSPAVDPEPICIADAAPRLVPFASRMALDAFLAGARHRLETGRAAREESLARARLVDDGGTALGGDAEISARTLVTVESVTNNQLADVDEGDIVKAHGSHLVVLRRGRLFTLGLGPHGPRLLAKMDVPPPPHDAANDLTTEDDEPDDDAWYDELLVHGDTAIVTGYSYARAATELSLFGIDAAGRLTRRARYFLGSGDYYSGRDYASRLVGDKLVVYAPIELVRANRDPSSALLPIQRDRRDDATELVDATQVAGPVQRLGERAVLHTIVGCDVAMTSLRCSARGVIAPPDGLLFVAPDAAYVWVHDDPELVAGAPDGSDGRAEPSPPPALVPSRPDAVLYRMPLDGAAIGAVRVAGRPLDSLSFAAPTSSTLSVFVRADDDYGDDASAPALVQVPLDAIDASAPTLAPSAYTTLPALAGYDLQNRFVGDWLLYGAGTEDAADHETGSLYAHSLAHGITTRIAVSHSIERIDSVGDHAIAVGHDGSNLLLTTVSLGTTPDLEDQLVRPGDAQGETRTHGFSFHATSEHDGVLGLPLRAEEADPYSGAYSGDGSAARVLFVGVHDGRLHTLGSLDATRAGRPPETTDADVADDASEIGEPADGCFASCEDWYGNARPIFYRGGTFALLGYELVEGRLDPAAGISEIGRASFIPRPRHPAEH